jgi:hypothetical protein
MSAASRSISAFVGSQHTGWYGNGWRTVRLDAAVSVVMVAAAVAHVVICVHSMSTQANGIDQGRLASACTAHDGYVRIAGIADWMLTLDVMWHDALIRP